MALANPAPLGIPAVPALPRWTWPALILLVLTALVVGYDQGALVDPVVRAITRSAYLHEFFHDGRHLLAFPCH